MLEIYKQAVNTMLPEKEYYYNERIGGGSTDMGDLCCIMPVIHPYASGATGNSHGSEYYITDPVAACVDSAKVQVAMLKLLLSNGAEQAKKIIDEFVPIFASKEEYFNYIDAINSSGDRIDYSNGINVSINVK